MRYLLLFILFIPFSGLKAQTKTISGTVSDLNSEKLVGINIDNLIIVEEDDTTLIMYQTLMATLL